MKPSREGYKEMFLENYKLVVSYIFRMLPCSAAEAEEMALEIFAAVYQDWETLRHHENITLYLMKKARDRIRQVRSEGGKDEK